MVADAAMTRTILTVAGRLDRVRQSRGDAVGTHAGQFVSDSAESTAAEVEAPTVISWEDLALTGALPQSRAGGDGYLQQPGHHHQRHGVRPR
jgi:hypothetical protein